MAYSIPETVPAALGILAGGGVRIVAGGTDFFPVLGDRPAPSGVLDVSRLAELRGIARTATGWSIGAATTWSDLIGADLPPVFDALKDAARSVGSVQIQNAGTVAGNLCNASPAADGIPPLLVLDALVELRALGGARFVPLPDFITGVRRIDLRPDELVCAIHIPDVATGAQGCFVKLGSRRYLVISIAMVAALVALDESGRIDLARVAVGACSAVAARLKGLETALIGLDAVQLDKRPEIWSRHLDPLSPIGDVRGTGAYRLDAAAELCRRAVGGAMGAVMAAAGGVDG